MSTATKIQVRATTENLIALLSSSKGAKIVTITTKTVPSMIRTADDGRTNPFVGKNLKDTDIRKVSRVNGMVNWSYSNAVNNQRSREEKEMDFEAKPRKWGERMKGLPFVVHVTKDGKVKLYLEMKVERSLEHWYENTDGDRIESARIRPFLRKSSSTRQGLDKEVILRDYDLSNILSIAYGGETYIIEDNLTLAQDLAAIK